MSERIIEIASDNRYLSVKRGFMRITENGEEIGCVPLDDLGAVVANAHGLSYSNNLLVALAERNVPLVLCGANHNPVGMLWPVDGYHRQAARMDAQLRATKPLMKQLWKKIVQAKIAQQAGVLETIGMPSAPLVALISKVRSGDTANIEATAARRYWTLLFGSDFRRDRGLGGINSMLNYGYMVARAATARAVMAAGLHPTLGINHSNANNPMRLVDDLIEPFRPMIDLAVFYLSEKGTNEVSSEAKKALVNVLVFELQAKQGRSAVNICMQNLAVSLGQVYMNEREDLDLPVAMLPLELAILENCSGG